MCGKRMQEGSAKIVKEVVTLSDPWVDMWEVCDECYKKYQDPEELKTANKILAGDQKTIEKIKKKHLKVVEEVADNLNEALQGTDIIAEHKGVSFVKGPKKPQ